MLETMKRNYRWVSSAAQSRSREGDEHASLLRGCMLQDREGKVRVLWFRSSNGALEMGEGEMYLVVGVDLISLFERRALKDFSFITINT